VLKTNLYAAMVMVTRDDKFAPSRDKMLLLITYQHSISTSITSNGKINRTYRAVP